jgi:hypothetical protein
LLVKAIHGTRNGRIHESSIELPARNFGSFYQTRDLLPTIMSVARSSFSRLPAFRVRSFSTSTSLASLSAAALPKAEQISAEWQGTSATGGTTKNFIGGEFLDSKTSQWIDVLDPVSPCLYVYFFAIAPRSPVHTNPAVSCPPYYQ